MNIERCYNRGKSKIGAPIIAVALVLALGGGCAQPSYQDKLTKVAKDWCDTIGASQVIPVYPMTQDLEVGDVFLTQTTIANQRNAYNAKGFLPLDDFLVRLPCTNFNNIYFDGYWKDQFGGTNTPHPVPSFTNGTGYTNILTPAPLPRAAFPTYSVQSISGGGFNAAFPIQGIPVALGYLDSQEVDASITISDARTYAGDPSRLLAQLETWATNDVTTHDLLARTASNALPNPIFLRVVSRVYYARAVDVSLHRAGSQGASAKAGMINNVSILATNSNNATDNYNNLLNTLGSNATTAASALTNAAQVGGAVKFVSASTSTVGLSQSFDALLAIGYLGFDVPVYTNGDIGDPIPTFQHIGGNNKYTRISEPSSAEPPPVAQRYTEKHRDYLKQFTNSAAESQNGMARYIHHGEAATNLPDVAKLLTNGTPAEINHAYWMIRREELGK